MKKILLTGWTAAAGVALVLFAQALNGGGVLAAPDGTTASVSVQIYDAKTGEITPMEKVQKTKEEWKKILSPEQYHIMREKGTERAFTGQYHANHEKGMYKCAGCGTDLFSSEAKFDSGTGWPSYWKPVSDNNVALKPDNTFFMRRTEVLCARCEAHLGHVFDDGPAPTHKRFCINSAALKFQADGGENG